MCPTMCSPLKSQLPVSDSTKKRDRLQQRGEKKRDTSFSCETYARNAVHLFVGCGISHSLSIHIYIYIYHNRVCNTIISYWYISLSAAGTLGPASARLLYHIGHILYHITLLYHIAHLLYHIGARSVQLLQRRLPEAPTIIPIIPTTIL